MRLNGYMTLEASFIFAFLTGLIVLIVNLDFFLHDSLLSDAVKVVGAVRYRESKNFYYEYDDGGIDIGRIACSTVFSENDKNASSAEIDRAMEACYEEWKLGTERELSETEIEDICNNYDSAEIVRRGGRIMQLIGGGKEDDD